MKGRSPIAAAMMTVGLAVFMSGCAPSEPAAGDQEAAVPSEPGRFQRGLDTVADARALQETINARSE